MAKPNVVIPPGSEKTYERFHFAPAVRVGDLLYCSGVIGADGANVPDDAGEEFTAAFASLASVLDAAGGSLADVEIKASFMPSELTGSPDPGDVDTVQLTVSDFDLDAPAAVSADDQEASVAAVVATP